VTAKASDASRARRQAAAAPRTTCRVLDRAFLYETSGDERVVCVCGLCSLCVADGAGCQPKVDNCMVHTWRARACVTLTDKGINMVKLFVRYFH
jgi:hypothetical protein